MSTEPISPDASALCTACGLCCSGPLFNIVEVALPEVGLAMELGLPLLAEEDGPAIPFPCVKLVDRILTGD